MAHIAIVGAGIGGVPCAFELRSKPGKEHRVTLIGSSPYFEFTPSNPWVAQLYEKCVLKALGIVPLKAAR